MIHVAIVAAILGITHMVCFVVMTERKYSVRKTAFIYAVFCVLFIILPTGLSCVFGGSSGITVIISFFLTIIIALFVFMFTSADAACKKVFMFLSYANVFCIFQCISIILCSVFFHDLSESATTYIKNIIRTALYIPMIWVYVKYTRPSVRMILGKQKKTWYSLTVVSVLFLAVFFLFMMGFHMDETRIEKYIAFFVLAVMTYCSVLCIVFETVHYMMEQNTMELVNQNMKYLQGQLEVAKENELYAKTVRHDLRHHSRNLMAMLKDGKVQEALNYIDKYDESLDGSKSKIFCTHITVNAILNSFYTKAKNEGISFSVAADIREGTAVSDMDWVAILSNILENAINGCVGCNSDGEIKVNIRTIADKIVIVCSNPCRSGLVIENHMLRNRGIGIDSMLAAARKYNSEVRYSVENEILTVCIILKI